MERWNQIGAFLGGWKPAVLARAFKLCDDQEIFEAELKGDYLWMHRLQKEAQKLLQYPHTVTDIIEGKRRKKDGKRYVLFHALFFQTEDKKALFLEMFQQKPIDTAIGLALGFPPKAVEAFEQGRRGIGIDYNGIQFASPIEDVAENLQWLWDHVPVPEEKRQPACVWLAIHDEWNEWDVPYRDTARAKEVQKILAAIVEK